MGKTPTVSVLVPVRNGQDFISDCIESLYSQSFQDFEVLVIDNQSVDATRDICEKLLDKRSRFVTNDREPKIAHALNLGIKLSRGKYIARLDSDDVARSDRFERQVNFLEENPEVGIVGSWMGTFGDRRLTWKYPLDDADIKLSILFRSPFGHPSVMFRTSWDHGERGFYDPSYDYAEDWELWSRICQVTVGANLPEPLTLYRMHSGQETKSNEAARAECVSQIVAKYCANLGIPPPSPRPSLRAFIRWWSAVEKYFRAQGSIDRNVVRRNATSHGFILIRQFLREAFGEVRLLSFLLGLRDFLERRTK